VPPWYETLFGPDYLRAWAPLTPPEHTEAEVDGIARLLDLSAGSRILDLCCGYGRHAIPLAQRGYQVTGYDLSEPLLDKARADASAESVEVRWVRGDMRALPFEAEFDAVVNLFTAFGYFEDEAEDLQVLQGVRRALKPGGRLLLDTINREKVIRHFQPYGVTRHADGLITLDERELDLLNSRCNVRLTLLFPDGTRREHAHSTRLYSLTEMARLLHAAGLDPEAHYGSLSGAPYTLDSRLVVLASRPE
jgi:SAM-dependent methyltransferase